MYEKKIIYKEQIVKELSNKRFCDLSSNFKSFVQYMYPTVEDDDLIICKRRNGSKIDFTICINNVNKNVSVKKGDIICVYKDRIINLILFLFSIKVSKDCILAMLYYHYADGTYDGSGVCVESFGQLLSFDYKEQIEIVNNEFKNKDLLARVVDYVLINERNGKKVDYFYFGDSRRGFYESAERVKYNIVNEENNYKHNYMRIGVMNFMPLKRELVYTDKSSYLKHFCILKINIKRYIKK